LIGALFGNRDGFNVAQEVIADRPLAGYENLQQITESGALDDLENDGGTFADRLALQTKKVDLQIDIRLGDQVRGYIASFEIGEGNRVKLISRRTNY